MLPDGQDGIIRLVGLRQSRRQVLPDTPSSHYPLSSENSVLCCRLLPLLPSVSCNVILGPNQIGCLRVLDLNELNNGLPAITPELGKVLAQVAGVCLESQGHHQGVHLQVSGYVNNTHALTWPPSTDQALRTWADPQEKTEYGATAIAVLLAKKGIGYPVIERAVKGTGIDYWLGHETNGLPFQRKARLEISGILSVEGSDSDVAKTVAARVREKLRQTQSSSGSFPAYVIVVEFGRPLAEVRET